MQRIAEDTNHPLLTRYADCELIWQPITDIEPDGIEHTYDVFVPDLENLVVNEFIVHNSAIEQTADKFFGLWRPWLTEPHFDEGGRETHVTVDNHEYPVRPELLLMQMLKQRFEDGRWTWALRFQPQYLKLCALETDIDEPLELQF